MTPKKSSVKSKRRHFSYNYRNFNNQDATHHQLLTEAQEDHDSKRKEMQRAMMEENQQIAKAKKDKEAKDRQFELKMEQYTTDCDQANPFFNEHFDTTQSALGPHRYVPYNFKGLRPDQIEQIKLEREQQVKEAEMKKKQEEEEDKLWGIQQEQMRKLKIKQDRELKKNQRDMEAAQSVKNTQLKNENYMKWKDPYGDRS